VTVGSLYFQSLLGRSWFSLRRKETLKQN